MSVVHGAAVRAGVIGLGGVGAGRGGLRHWPFNGGPGHEVAGLVVSRQERIEALASVRVGAGGIEVCRARSRIGLVEGGREESFIAHGRFPGRRVASNAKSAGELAHLVLQISDL